MFAGLLIILLAFGGCTSSHPDGPPTYQVITEIPSELVFELPADWIESSTVNARIFGGPPGTTQESATVTLQTLSPRWRQAPDLALRSALKAAGDLSPTLLHQNPVILTTPSHTRSALLYSMAFTHHREPFRRVGLLISHREQLIDLHYTANTKLFATSLPVFEDLIESLSAPP